MTATCNACKARALKVLYTTIKAINLCTLYKFIACDLTACLHLKSKGPCRNFLPRSHLLPSCNYFHYSKPSLLVEIGSGMHQSVTMHIKAVLKSPKGACSRAELLSMYCPAHLNQFHKTRLCLLDQATQFQSIKLFSEHKLFIVGYEQRPCSPFVLNLLAPLPSNCQFKILLFVSFYMHLERITP